MKYANRMTKENTLLLYGLWSKLSLWVEDKHCQLDKEQMKNVRMSMTYAKKSADAIVASIGQDFAKKLSKQARDLESIEVNYKRTFKDKPMVTVEEEELYNVADIVLALCSICKNKKFKTCPIYHSLIALDIPVCRTETENCPYRLDDDEYLSSDICDTVSWWVADKESPKETGKYLVILKDLDEQMCCLNWTGETWVDDDSEGCPVKYWTDMPNRPQEV